MHEILVLLVPAFLIFLLLKIITKPMKLIFKLLINTACGFVCLFLLNALAGITGYVFTVNFVTAAIVGVLGMPGILLLILSSFLL